jgi:peptidoglycan/LPS O-acetylase OafA/YrhL
MVLFAIAMAIVLANLALGMPGPAALVGRHPAVIEQLSIDSLYLIFMFIGVLFNYHVRGLLRTAPFLAALFGMTLLFLACWRASLIAEQFPVVTYNYMYALGLFGLAYALRRYARPVLALDFFAAISFPLYLVHSIVGFSILKVLMITARLSYGVALPLTLAAVIGLAALLHYTVERASVALGRRCAPTPRIRRALGAQPG